MFIYSEELLWSSKVYCPDALPTSGVLYCLASEVRPRLGGQGRHEAKYAAFALRRQLHSSNTPHEQTLFARNPKDWMVVINSLYELGR